MLDRIRAVEKNHLFNILGAINEEEKIAVIQILERFSLINTKNRLALG